MKKFFIVATILAMLGLGFWLRLIAFDPVSALTLVVLIATQLASFQRQEQLSTVVKKSHEVLASNQKTLSNQLNSFAADLKRIKNG